MAKHIKHDFNKGRKGMQDKPAENKTVEMKNIIQQKTSKEIVDIPDNVNQFADIALRVLREKLGLMCDITKDERNHQGNIMYHINKKGVPLQAPKNGDPSGDGQIILTIIKDCTLQIRCNPYGDNPEYIYYHAEGLDTKGFVAEMAACKSFLSDGTIPANSKLKQDNECNGMSKEDMDALLAGYE